MNKLAQLLKSIDKFYNKAVLSYLTAAESYTMPDDAEEALSVNSDLIAESQKYDIKDEELYNQFETFMETYKELVDSLSVSLDTLTPESMQDAAQLIDVLNTRYVRILKNPYLNISADEGYDEDFDPGDFTDFIQKVVTDAESKLKTIAGEDADIGEMRSAQYAQEFNQVMVDRGDKNLRFTGDKVQQLLEARKNWFKNLMFIKKVGKSHPEYDRFEAYMATRHKSYRNIMEDPERKKAYRKKANERQIKFNKKLQLKKQELMLAIRTTHDPKKLEELKEALAGVEKGLEARKNKRINEANRIREIKKSDTLTSLIIHLQQKLATYKNEVAKSIKKHAANDPHFNPFKQAVREAKEKLDREPFSVNQAALEEAIRKEAAAIKNYLENHEAVAKVKNDLVPLYGFRNQTKELDKINFSSNEAIPDVVKTYMHHLISSGEKLISTYGNTYRAPCATIKDIVELLRGKL